MHLIIDIGNSSAKIALIKNGLTQISECYDELSVGILENLIAQNSSISAAIISTTGKLNIEAECYVKSQIEHTIIFDHTTPQPLTNQYGTPQTLGMDRLAAAVGAWTIEPNQELMIFDLGTAITIDRVTAAGEFIGGNISPGVQMRFEALHNFTCSLPLVKYDQVQPQTQFGNNTAEAIWNGVILGIEHEIDGYITRNRGVKLFFTGRDAKYFVKWRENAIFADSQLVIKGLERIIEYNAKKRNW